MLFIMVKGRKVLLKVKQERIENSEVNTGIYAHLLYIKGAKDVQWRKDNLFNKWFWENGADTCKRMKLDPYLIPYTNTQLKLDQRLEPKA